VSLGEKSVILGKQTKQYADQVVGDFVGVGAILDGEPVQDHLCPSTLLSREQYLPDIQAWGDADARTLPGGPMKAEDVGVWTEAIGQ
jgi:hypothetical protein